MLINKKILATKIRYTLDCKSISMLHKKVQNVAILETIQNKART